MNSELLRIVENIARDKNVDPEYIFEDLEAAMVSAVKKYLGQPESEIIVQIDRETGALSAWNEGESIDVKKLGRIPAQTAKQVMIQKIRQDERSSIYSEFSERKGEIVSGNIVRYEGPNAIVALNSRTEAILPRGEQISGQSHRTGERIRALLYDVKESTSQVKILLSRTHPDFIRGLFELEVPEIAEGIIETHALAREAGYRTKIAVASTDEKVDPVGACVGIRGSRIKNIVDELGGEKIDIVRWSESSQELIKNALMPSKISEIALCFELGRASVVVDPQQLSLAIGRHGQNVRLAARLTGWDIDILTPDEYNEGVDKLTECVTSVEGVTEQAVDQLIALGVISVIDLADIGSQPLIEELGFEQELAKKLVETAEQKAKEIAASEEKNKAKDLLEKETKKQKPEQEQSES